MSALAGIKTIKDLELANKRVFIRVDFNVPQDKATKAITDDARIRAALPTIQYAMEQGARVILASHLGRPKPGKRDATLEPCGKRLAELTGYEVLLPEDCVGDAPKKLISELRAKQIVLLENLRFHEEEEKNDEGFARQLAELCDVYVDDAFGCAHRAHASVHALPKLMREKACGFLMEKEIDKLGKIVSDPDKPYLAILGGAKVSDKIAVVEALLNNVTALVIGGAMANTFLKALGKDTKASKIEEDKLALARTIVEKAADKKVDLVLPIDVVVAADINATEGKTVSVDEIPDGMMALDIGPKTLALIEAQCKKAKSVFWNGPMGLFENKPFSGGTFGVAKAIAASKAFSVVGGGDSAAAVKDAGPEVEAGFTHISTGGGASLELVEGRKLPGIEILRSAQ
ncbi:MAG: phosphoglycerate kinase [Deltaproteobacteria bacterium]|nr:phosphoglycerate kinase [Deltaproteobacteria bacterium]